MPTVDLLLTDLEAENSALDSVVAEITPEEWSRPTPAAGWDVRDSISHLCFFDEAAWLAVTKPEGFEDYKANLLKEMAAAQRDPDAPGPDVALGRSMSEPSELLHKWRQTRNAYIDAARAEATRAEPRRIPWFGPAMSLASFTTARILEAWAHGVDVRDALGVPLEFTDRLRHVCHIGVGARAFSFAIHGVDDPGDPIRVEAAPPGGEPWSWGPEDAVNRVTGPALELALVLAQRRHRSRTQVKAEGPVAEQWLEIAQAFAGPPTYTSPDR
jgi:uncharacterized protein (TIGR03084 family)